MTLPLNPAMAATFGSPGDAEARRWLSGVTFPPERPINRQVARWKARRWVGGRRWPMPR